MFRFSSAIFLVSVFALPFVGMADAPATLRVANYNVENLFDPWINQPTNTLTGQPADADWCAASWRRWTPERYNVKLERLAWVLDKMQADVVALEEVENRGVLEDLCRTLSEKYGWTYPNIAHVDCSDPRGIDVAILSKWPIVSQTFRPMFRRRGLLAIDVDVDGFGLVVVASHWKSQLGDAADNIAIRTEEASRLRDYLLERLAKDPNIAFVACGDYNEDMDGPAISNGLNPANDRESSLSSLELDPEEIRPFNLIGDIPEAERGSYYYARRKVWNTFDGLIVSPRMLLPQTEPGPDWRVGEASDTETFHLDEMRWGADGRPNSYRRVRAEGQAEKYYTDGYSDHFPVVTTLKLASGQDSDSSESTEF